MPGALRRTKYLGDDNVDDYRRLSVEGDAARVPAALTG